mgnify:CR=1 FL=1
MDAACSAAACCPASPSSCHGRWAALSSAQPHQRRSGGRRRSGRRRQRRRTPAGLHHGGRPPRCRLGKSAVGGRRAKADREVGQDPDQASQRGCSQGMLGHSAPGGSTHQSHAERWTYLAHQLHHWHEARLAVRVGARSVQSGRRLRQGMPPRKCTCRGSKGEEHPRAPVVGMQQTGGDSQVPDTLYQACAQPVHPSKVISAAPTLMRSAALEPLSAAGAAAAAANTAASLSRCGARASAGGVAVMFIVVLMGFSFGLAACVDQAGRCKGGGERVGLGGGGGGAGTRGQHPALRIFPTCAPASRLAVQPIVNGEGRGAESQRNRQLAVQAAGWHKKGSM